jgi:2-methylisoborneol synthase
MRACNTTFQMYVSWTAYAAWRYLRTLPPAWRYLAARQHDSFYTSMTLIDVVGGYELPDSNLVLLIAAEENIPVRDATIRAVALHNDFVRGFEASQRELTAVPPGSLSTVALHRFLRGAQAWMAGGIEWHGSSDRYR